VKIYFRINKSNDPNITVNFILSKYRRFDFFYWIDSNDIDLIDDEYFELKNSFKYFQKFDLDRLNLTVAEINLKFIWDAIYTDDGRVDFFYKKRRQIDEV
jgi:hypothetical protein